MNKYLLAKLIDDKLPIINYKEGGNSMVPLIYSKQPVDVWPCDSALIGPGDMVVARVHGIVYNHLVTAVQGNRVQISSNHGKVNGWTHRSKVYGIVTHVEGTEVPGAWEKVDGQSISNYKESRRRVKNLRSGRSESHGTAEYLARLVESDS